MPVTFFEIPNVVEEAVKACGYFERLMDEVSR